MFFKKILLNLFIMFFISFYLAAAYAGPVFPEDVMLMQSDGSTFISTPYGDEWHNGHETKDGYTILFDSATKNWVYADIASDGSLIKTKSVVNKDMPLLMPVHVRPFLSPSPNSIETLNGITAESLVKPATGNHKVLVVLVQFANRTLVTTTAQWSDLIFSNTSFSKVRDFYKEASYNNIDLIPASETYGTANDGVVKVTLSYNHPNTAGSTGDTNKQLTKDALIAANPYVNFSLFDTNSDGSISTNELHIVIIVAGYESSYGGASSCSPSVWGHRWQLSGTVTPPTLDGKLLTSVSGYGDYTQFGEWHCSTSDTPGHMATMGIIAHELGHSLWLPDEYDTDLSSEGVGKWGLMGSGSWNTCFSSHAGNCPSHPTAWDKSYLGWLTPTLVSGKQTVSIPDVTSNATAFRLLNNPGDVDWSFTVASGTGEYFLAENRQLTGYNAGLPGDGLLIWHIWEGASSSNSANQNELGRRLIDLREADGLNHLDLATNRGDAGDPFPGTSNKTAFNNISSPSSKLYCSSIVGFCNQSYASVANISVSAPTMTADMTDTVVQLSSALYNINESSASLTITVQRFGDTSGTSTVNYATSNGTAISGSDYTAASGTLSFTAGQVSKTITVPITNDSTAEIKETFNITLSSPSGTALGNSTSSIYILDDEPTAVRLSSTSYNIDEALANVTITVQRLGTSGSFTVNYATSNSKAIAGSDYTAVSGTLSFSSAQDSKTFSVPVLNDTIAELKESFKVTLSLPAGAVLSTPGSAFVYILDNEPAAVQFSGLSYTVNETSASAIITVSRVGSTGGSSTVTYNTNKGGTATAGSDYTAVSGTLKFLGGQNSKTFTVPVIDDLVSEPNETVNLLLSSPAGAVLGTPAGAVLNITSNE